MPDIVAACSPYLQDAVIAGQDKPFVGLLAWPSAAGLQALAADPGPGTAVEKLYAHVAERLKAFNVGAGGSSRREPRSGSGAGGSPTRTASGGPSSRSGAPTRSSTARSSWRS